jgi:PAS domain S-box-containing protein
MSEHVVVDGAAPVDALRHLQAHLAELEQQLCELRATHEELVDFVERAAVGLHWVAADGTILWANQAELDLLGYTSAEYIGRHIAEFHADPEVIDDILTRLMRDETLHSYEARLRGKDGSIRYVLISSNVRRQDGDFVHTRCFTRDITARREAELRELAATSALAQEREAFLSTAAHELKTPLTTVKAAAQLLTRRLARPAPDPEALMVLARQVEDQAGRMETLVNELLNLSRLDATALSDRRVWSDLREVALAAYERATLSPARTARHTMVLDAAESISGWWDAERLDQVVTNLLSNALKYSPAGGDVTLALARDGDEAVLMVRDQGLGMSAHTQAQLFQPFARGDALASDIAGTGLGLYITARVVTAHGGTIAVESVAGIGSTFTVRLPLMTLSSTSSQTAN